MRRHPLPRVEQLEPRLALAGLATFTDFDGDTVTVRSTRGTDVELAAALGLVPSGFMGGMQLERVDLTAWSFARTSLFISARPSVLGGNGLVDVGEIVTSHDIGMVSVGGDLGRILAGDSNESTPGMTSLVVGSLGVRSTATGALDNRSTITGSIQSIKIDGDLTAALLEVTGRATEVAIGGNVYGMNPYDGILARSIGSIVVTGGIFGGGTDYSGRVEARGPGGIGRLRVFGDLTGGVGNNSGQVWSAGPVGVARIGGAISGSSGYASGSLYAGGAGITRLIVGADIFGGSNDFAGAVTTGFIGSAMIGGSIYGGSAQETGRISATRGIGTLEVMGDIQGGAGVLSGSVSADLGRIGTVRVRSILAGDGGISGALSAASLGDVLVRGDMSGSSSQFAHISAVGAATPTGPRAIRSLTVRGNMARASVFAGYRLTAPINGAARVGPVSVGGSFTASNIVAGVANPLTPGIFGNGGDASIGGTGASRIESLVIAGTATGSFDPAESYGVVARSIGRVRINGVAYAVPRIGGVAPSGDNLSIRLV